MKNKNLPLNYKERNNSKISLLCSIAALIVLFLVFNQIDYSFFRKPAKEAAQLEKLEKKKAEEEAARPAVTTVRVTAAGNNLYHNTLLESGQYNSGWNYEHVYENIKGEISAADLAIVNQDTVLTSNHDAISSYPSFATPTEVGDALVAAGFDVIQSATNNVDDFGYDFIAQTLDFWRSKHPDITVPGLHETKEDAEGISIREVNGIKIAFLNYTYGTNGSGAGDGKDFVIDILDKAKVTAALQKAKQVSDCIIFSAHWGPENDPMPDEYQKEWAAFLMQNGVDVLLGSHPYTLQPYGRLTDDNGNRMLVFYSLGNFVTGQESLEKLLGGLAEFTIQKTVDNGNVTVDILDPVLKPVVMHSDSVSGTYGPVLLDSYTQEMAESHDVREIIGEEFSLENLRNRYRNIMRNNVEPSTDTSLLNESYKAENSSEESYDDGSYDDGAYDDGSYDDGSYDDGSYDDGSYDDGSYDDGSYDDGSYDDGSYDDGSYDDGAYDDGGYYE